MQKKKQCFEAIPNWILMIDSKERELRQIKLLIGLKADCVNRRCRHLRRHRYHHRLHHHRRR
jgi:hypothetical protein